MNINFEMAISNNIDVKDITLISYLSLISEKEELGEENGKIIIEKVNKI